MRIPLYSNPFSRRTGTSIVCSALVWMGSVGAVPARATESVTNYDLMKNLTGAAVTSVLDDVRPASRKMRVRLVPFAADEEHQFVTNIVSGEMKSRGFDPVLGANGDDALEFRFQLLAFNLDYTDVYRAHLVGGKRIRRSASIRLLVTLVDPASGSVLWTGEREQQKDDQFRAGELARVEASTFAFTRPEMPGSGWGKYAEPVVVSGIVVGLVYLFFSNQIE